MTSVLISLFCTSGPNLVILERVNLSRRQGRGWHTDRQTDRRRQRQYPKGQNWHRVKVEIQLKKISLTLSIMKYISIYNIQCTKSSPSKYDRILYTGCYSGQTYILKQVIMSSRTDVSHSEITKMSGFIKPYVS